MESTVTSSVTTGLHILGSMFGLHMVFPQARVRVRVRVRVKVRVRATHLRQHVRGRVRV